MSNVLMNLCNYCLKKMGIHWILLMAYLFKTKMFLSTLSITTEYPFLSTACSSTRVSDLADLADCSKCLMISFWHHPGFRHPGLPAATCFLL